jgi:hypothetical protein
VPSDIFGTWQAIPRLEPFKFEPETIEYHKDCPKGILSIYMQFRVVNNIGKTPRASYYPTADK